MMVSNQLETMWPLFEYLKSPELVVQFQEWFGVKYNRNYDANASQSMEYKLKENGTTAIDNKQSSTTVNRLLRSATNGTKTHSNGISSRIDNGNGTMNHIVDDHDNDNDNDTDTDTDANEEPKPYVITNLFWYYLFRFGTELGDEIFYASMIPFWFWNIDGAVGRRVVYIWSIIMYIGQGLKDIIRWPRPGPPVHQLQSKWGLEYGMPSTHAMIGFCMPFSVVIFMIDRYQFSIEKSLILSSLYCGVICLSRIYLGMHSILDVLVGIGLSVLLLIPLVPLVNAMDDFILKAQYAPVFILAISILLIVYYPRSDKWTPTRGDTAMTTSVAAGIQLGAWINYQLGYMVTTTTITEQQQQQPPYEILWPTYGMIGLIILRTILGLCCIVACRAIAKSICYAFVCILLGRNKNELKNSENSLENRDKIVAELCYKYVSCCIIGINIQFLMPNVFKMLEIGRPDFFTEI